MKIITRRITKKDLDIALEIIDRIRTDAQEDQEYAFDDPWLTFHKKMRLLTAQSSGNRIQNYIFKALGWTRVSPGLNMGDVKNTLEQHFEVKITTITPSNRCANIVQIRLWQQISGYYIFVIDATTEDYELTSFSLSKSEMEREVELRGQSAHGTKETNKSNEKVEWAIRINWDEDDETYKRWIMSYRQNIHIKEQKEKTRKGKTKNMCLFILLDG